MASIKPVKKTYASAQNPSMFASLQGLYRYPTREGALKRLAILRRKFMIAEPQAGVVLSEHGMLLWVREYEVSDEQREKGYLGHFTILEPKEADGHWMLQSQKVELPLKFHPLRKYPQSQRHPNWGHPTLRAVKKGKRYANADKAQAELMRLHATFPETTIPGEYKLYLMIYGRAESSKQPIQKYIFQVKPLENGECTIEAILNERQAKRGNAISKPSLPAPKPIPQGRFATMVQIKRKKPLPRAAGKRLERPDEQAESN